MKILKVILIILFTFTLVWIGIRIFCLKFYLVPTGSMENTIPIETLIMAWKKQFKPARFEIIIYKNPANDTVSIPHSYVNYYTMIRSMGKDAFDAQYEKTYVPINKREDWIGRCVGLPGDTIQLINSKLFVNNQEYTNPDVKHRYQLRTKNDIVINTIIFEELAINQQDVYKVFDQYMVNLTSAQYNDIRNRSFIESVHKDCINQLDIEIFPHTDNLNWNKDNFGKLLIPQKGKTIKLDSNNLEIYKRLITIYEKNLLEIDDNEIIINGKKTDFYIPIMDCYFIVCDNRDNASDSRYWGFLPENHISGKIIKIYN